MNEQLKYNAKISFEGSPKDVEQIADELIQLKEKGLKIDTASILEHPAKSLMIDTVPLPEKYKGLVIGPNLTQETIKNAIAIGTWPTPDKPTLQIVRWPRPIPFPGLIAASKILNTKILEELGKDMTKLRVRIDGGMNDPHFHFNNEIVMLTKDRFQKYMGHIIEQLGQDLQR